MVKHKIVSICIFLAITIVVLGLNALPNYYASVNTPDGKSFSGQASWFDPWDLNLYISGIRWGQQGHILLQNSYTTTPHLPILMRPIYTMAGFMFRDISPVLLFHLLALIFGFVLLLLTFRLARIFCPNSSESLLAVTLISLGGGLGWLFFPGFQSADLFMTGFTFVSHFQRAHEALGISFYMLALVTFYIIVEHRNRLAYLLYPFALIFAVILYPYSFLSIAVICGLYSLLIYFRNGDRGPVFFYLANIILVVPILLVYWIHLRQSPVFGGILSAQLDTPNIFQIASGFGVLTFFMVYQLRATKGKAGQLFLNIWFFASLVLAFLPFGSARFYLRTLFFPAVLLTLFSLDSLTKKISLPKKYLIIFLLLTLPLSSLYITYKRLAEVNNNNHWFYLTADEREALTFLDKQTPLGSGVLAAYTLGNYIPANTDDKVYFGQLDQTPQAQDKINQLLKFYANNLTDEEAQDFLKQNKIKYMVFGSEEQNITVSGSKETQLKYKFLKPAFGRERIKIFTF